MLILHLDSLQQHWSIDLVADVPAKFSEKKKLKKKWIYLDEEERKKWAKSQTPTLSCCSSHDDIASKCV